MMKVSGIWVSPFEVEAALIAHDAVLEAAVVGHEDADGLLKPRAFVVLTEAGHGDRTSGLAGHAEGPRQDPAAARGNTRAGSKPVEALPKTATGKIQRFRLRA